MLCLVPPKRVFLGDGDEARDEATRALAQALSGYAAGEYEVLSGGGVSAGLDGARLHSDGTFIAAFTG